MALLAFVLGVTVGAIPFFLDNAGVATFGMACGGLALLLLAGASFRTSRRALQIAAHTDSLTGLANSGRRSPARQAADVLLRVLHERSELPLGPHAVEVADLAEAVAFQMELPEHRVERLRQAAELHDVGKMAIPDAVVDKAGPLNDDEWSLMREHTLIGERILSSAPALSEVGRIVRATHERVDGGGYPDGLAGKEIPLEARIIAAADAFCVMTTERPYDAVRSTKGAMDELWRCSGTQFDPAVVEALAAVLTEMEEPAEPVAIARRAVGQRMGPPGLEHPC